MPTPAALLDRLAQSNPGDPLGVVLPIRAAGDKPAMFCVHPGTGLAWSYLGLLSHLDGDQPVYGIQARGLSDPAGIPVDIEAMAADYVACIRAVQSEGPYHLLGWSFGGVVVHAMAAQLLADGQQVGLVAILDGYPLDEGVVDVDPQDPKVLAALLLALGYDLGPDAAALRTEDFERIASEGNGLVAELDPVAIRALPAVFAANVAMLLRHRPSLLDADVEIFHATAGKVATDPMPADWQPYLTGEVTVHEIPQAHGALLNQPALSLIVPVIADRLRSASREPVIATRS